MTLRQLKYVAYYIKKINIQLEYLSSIPHRVKAALFRTKDYATLIMEPQKYCFSLCVIQLQ